MLLEMLASERAGEDALVAGEQFERDLTAERLCDQGMAEHCGFERVQFTRFGRYVAEQLADRIVDSDYAARLAS